MARSELPRLLQHLAGGAEAFHGLRHAAVDADDVAGRADLLDAAAVGDGAAAVGFPFVHLAEGADHGEVHQAAGLGIDRRVAPAERSEARRGGTECVSTGRSRWSPYH